MVNDGVYSDKSCRVTYKMATPNHAHLQDILNYTFSNLTLLDEATLAAGAAATSQHVDGGVEGNKPLALIGDALIRLHVAVKSYTDGLGTGQSGKVLSEVGSNELLDTLGRRLALDKFVTKNPCQQGDVPRTTVASTVEALIGAVWIDTGNEFHQVQVVIQNLGITEPFQVGGAARS
ncbi:ribonuclease III domain-containing protein [Cladorrhinum sp. PSN332]|nr:ribonuclease III domain-containing protein [Cladorrhinum sp. PSN332]